MIESIITDYLRGNRRLVIPGLGAFLRKEGGELVFVPFLNKDDGVLSGLVRQTYGSSTAEADEIIGQYVEQVRASLDERDAYLVVGLGSLKKDANGILFLDPADHASAPVKKAPVVMPLVEPEVPEEAPQEVLVIEEVIMEVPAAEEVVVVTELSKPEEKKPEAGSKPSVMPEEQRQAVFGEEIDAPKTFYDKLLEQQEKEKEKEPTPVPTAASFTRPEPAKPASTAPRSVTPPRPAPVRPEPAKVASPPPLPPAGKKKADLILILAIVVAAVAVAAMIYAYAVVDLPVFNLK